jgi:hypothetical protein
MAHRLKVKFFGITIHAEDAGIVGAIVISTLVIVYVL